MSYEYQREILIHATPEEVYDFHTEHTNLHRITPTGIHVTTTQSEPTRVGAIMKLHVRQFGIVSSSWVVEFTACERPFYLRDEMRKGPFAQWIQERHISASPNGTLLRDSVRYELPFGVLGSIAHRLFVRKRIEAMFVYRQQKTKELLEQASRQR